MRVSSKLAAVFSASVVTILTISAVFAVLREDERFWAERVADHDLLGRTLATLLQDTLAAQGDPGVEEEIARIGAPSSDLTIRWVAGNGSEAEANIAGYFTTEYPIVLEGVPRGRIVISESLAQDEAYVGTTILHAVWRTLAVVAGLVLTGWLAGVLIVGRPVQQLVERMQRIRFGNLAESIELRARDEFGTLASELNEMCRRLQATLDQLRHADRLATVGTLASGLAHELGTPLNVVLIRAKMIADADADATPEEHAHVIRDQAERMTALIRQLLDFARQSKPAKSRQDLRALCKQTLGVLDAIGAKKKVMLVLEPGEPTVADVDPGQVQQVITNLVLNGIQAMRAPGSVKIAVDSVTRSHAIEQTSPREFRRVVVSDAGDGIPRESLGRVFEPFFTTKDVGEGTGLGLAIVWGIVRENGGWVDVESEPGKGATFSVYLPSPGGG